MPAPSTFAATDRVTPVGIAPVLVVVKVPPPPRRKWSEETPGPLMQYLYAVLAENPCPVRVIVCAAVCEPVIGLMFRVGGGIVNCADAISVLVIAVGEIST